MAISPPVCPASHININQRICIDHDEKGMSFTYVDHIVDTFDSDPKMKKDHRYSSQICLISKQFTSDHHLID